MIVSHQHIFWHAQWDQKNQHIKVRSQRRELHPVDKDKLKDDQWAELEKATKAYEQECLKSFSVTRTGEVIKKFDFPAIQPLTEAQRENRVLDMVHQAVGHTFVSHAPIMTNSVHNAVVKALHEGGITRIHRACLSEG